MVKKPENFHFFLKKWHFRLKMPFFSCQNRLKTYFSSWNRQDRAILKMFQALGDHWKSNDWKTRKYSFSSKHFLPVLPFFPENAIKIWPCASPEEEVISAKLQSGHNIWLGTGQVENTKKKQIWQKKIERWISNLENFKLVGFWLRWTQKTNNKWKKFF